MTDEYSVVDARAWFMRYFDASCAKRHELGPRLLSMLRPQKLIDAALAEFREKGNGERLVLASDLLARFEGRAIGVLCRMAEQRLEECEYFVDTLATIATNPEYAGQAKAALQLWRRHPDRDVRLAVFMAITIDEEHD